MAAPIKKRAVGSEENENLRRNGDSESSNEENSEPEDIGIPAQQIQVDFEGSNPIDADFHGIKQLLHQLFLKAHVNLSELTDLIIGQNYVGSVVKQSEMEDEDSDDEGDVNDVFGITSVINLTEKQNLECVQHLRSLLLELCAAHASPSTNTFIQSLLGDDSRPVGLLINERFINIPAQIAVPLLESLSKEIKRAREKKMPFDFSYFIIICKLYKVDNSTKLTKKTIKSRQKGKVSPETLWSNPEEELIEQEAECQFEFSVKGESDSGLSGQWLEDDIEMTPMRRVLLVSANKLDSIIERIKAYVAQ